MFEYFNDPRRFRSSAGGAPGRIESGGIYVADVKDVATAESNALVAGQAKLHVRHLNIKLSYTPVAGQSPADPLVVGDTVLVTFLNNKMIDPVVIGRLDHERDSISGNLTVGGGDLGIGTTAAGETLNIAGVTTTSGAGSNLIVKGGDATGTNQGGAYLAIKPGMGTGSSISGDILLQTGPAGGSGTSQNTATTVLTCTSAGNVVVANDLTVGGNPYQKGAWSSWTPTVTGFTIGNATVVGKYAQFGKTVHFTLHITMGSTTSYGSQFIFTLPVARHTDTLFVPFSTRMTQGSSSYIGTANLFAGDDRVYAYAQQADNGSIISMNSTTPVTWTTGGSFACSGTYEAA